MRIAKGLRGSLPHALRNQPHRRGCPHRPCLGNEGQIRPHTRLYPARHHKRTCTRDLRCTRQPRHGRATRAPGDPHRSRFAHPRCAPSRLFLYDWHDPDPSHRLHGFTHPFAALARAEEDFKDLTPRERNIISRHMFPLVPIPPTCREAWLVCLADKACALHETIAGRLPKRPTSREEVSR